MHRSSCICTIGILLLVTITITMVAADGSYTISPAPPAATPSPAERLPRASIDYMGPLSVATALLLHIKRAQWQQLPLLFTNTTTIRYDNTPLPFAGEYHGIAGVTEFFSKFTSAVMLKSVSWESPYADVTIGTAIIELVTAGRFKRSNTNFTDHRQLLILQSYHDRIDRLEWVDQEPSKIVAAYQTAAERYLDAYHDALYRYGPASTQVLSLVYVGIKLELWAEPLWNGMIYFGKVEFVDSFADFNQWLQLTPNRITIEFADNNRVLFTQLYQSIYAPFTQRTIKDIYSHHEVTFDTDGLMTYHRMRLSRSLYAWEVFGIRSPEQPPIPRRAQNPPTQMMQTMSEPRLLSTNDDEPYV